MAELQTGQRPPAPPVAIPSSPPAAQPTAPLPSLPPPTAPGSLAPDPSTATPPQATATFPPTQPPPPPAGPTLPPLAIPTIPSISHQERWRAQQQDREVFPELLPFATSDSQLWWYDPVNQQHVILGVITGDFLAQARFRLLGQGLDALEVPYQVNVSYGLTALSPAILGRIAAAGYESDWIETYVYFSPEVTPR